LIRKIENGIGEGKVGVRILGGITEGITAIDQKKGNKDAS